MIKKYKLLIIFLLSNCSSMPNIDYGYFQNINDYIFRENIKITQEVYQKAEYSFIKVYYKRNEATFVLSSIDDRTNIFTWVGANNEKIMTWNGLIVEAEGFEFDLKIINQDIFNTHNHEINQAFKNIFPKLRFKEPYLEYLDVEITPIFNNTKTIYFKDADMSIDALEIILIKVSNPIGWKANEKIYFDDFMRAVYTEQQVHPHYPKLKVEFYYK